MKTSTKILLISLGACALIAALAFAAIAWL
jgi:hypothetical protein